MKQLVLFLVVGLTFLNSSYAGKERGGGLPDKIDEAALTLYLESNEFKVAILNYINTMNVDKIQDAEVRATAQSVLSEGALQRDVQTPRNYVAANSCFDSFKNSVPSSTEFGLVGGPICFNIKMLVAEYKNLSSEEATIRLAALALHEHIHHFQAKKGKMDETTLLAYEREAYRFGGYVKLTARFVQLPILEWSDEAKPKEQLRKQLRRATYELQYAREESEWMGELADGANRDTLIAASVAGAGVGVLFIPYVAATATGVTLLNLTGIMAVGGGVGLNIPISIAGQMYAVFMDKNSTVPFKLKANMALQSIDESLERVKFSRGEVDLSYHPLTDFLGARDYFTMKALNDLAKAKVKLLEMKVELLQALATYEEKSGR